MGREQAIQRGLAFKEQGMFMSRTALFLMTGTALLIGGGVCAGAYITGGVAEQKLTELARSATEQLSGSGLTGSKMEVTNYERGWFSSVATLTTTVSPATADAGDPALEPVSVEDQVLVRHGPVLFGSGGYGLGLARAEGDIAVAAAMGAWLRALAGEAAMADAPRADGEYVIQYAATFGFDGSAALSCSSQPAIITVTGEGPDESGTVSIGTLTCSGDLPMPGRESTTRFELDRASIAEEGDGMTLDLLDVAAEANLTPYTSDVTLGGGRFSIRELKLDDLRMSGLTFVTDMTVADDGTLRLFNQYQSGEFTVPIHGGKPIPMGPVRLDMSLVNIPLEAYTGYLEFLDMLTGADYDGQGNLPPAREAEALSKGIDLVNMLFDAGVALDVPVIEAGVPGAEQMTGSLYLGFEEGTALNLSQPTALLADLEGRADLSIPRALAEKVMALFIQSTQSTEGHSQRTVDLLAAASVEQLVTQSPFFLLKDDTVTLNADLADGGLSMNDAPPLPVAAMLEAIMNRDADTSEDQPADNPPATQEPSVEEAP